MEAVKEIIKKKPKRKPSLKQRAAFDKALENGGNISKAMTEVKYSPAMAKNPQKLTQSEGWKLLMDKHLSDDDLAKKHKELLHAKEIGKFDFSQDVSDEDIQNIIEKGGGTLIQIESIDTVEPKFRRKTAYYSTLNARAVKDALDMSYKLKGVYTPEAPTVQHNTINIFESGLKEKVSAFEADIKKQLGYESDTQT